MLQAQHNKTAFLSLREIPISILTNVTKGVETTISSMQNEGFSTFGVQYRNYGTHKPLFMAHYLRGYLRWAYLWKRTPNVLKHLILHTVVVLQAVQLKCLTVVHIHVLYCPQLIQIPSMCSKIKVTIYNGRSLYLSYTQRAFVLAMDSIKLWT